MGQVKLILREDIPKLGDAGDLVSVKPGFARNYLLPKGLASIATEARVKELEHHRRIITANQAKLLKDLQGTERTIQAMDLSFEAQAGEAGKLFGSITAANIADRIKEQGVEVDRRKVQLREPIKEVGEHEVSIRLHKELTVSVKVSVTAVGAPVAAEPVLARGSGEGEEPVVFGGADEDHVEEPE